MYLSPAPTRIDQSVIVANVYFHAIDEVRKGLILTPRCDIAQGRAELIHACALFDAWDVVEDFVRNEWKKMKLVNEDGTLISGPLVATKQSDFANSLRQVIAHRMPRFHWLAPLPGESIPQILDFQVLTSVAIDELASKPILAGLSAPFGEEVSARYASFMGRVGTPDHLPEQIEQWVQEASAALFPSRPQRME
jgi:hypothetical protein